jgi:predicted exporter
MTDAERVAELRDLLTATAAQGGGTTRVIAVVGSLLLIALVLWLVRNRRLREEYTPIWLVVAAGIAAVSLHQGLLHALTRAIGA